MGSSMTRRKGYAVIGTGSRAGVQIEAIFDTYRDSSELAALCDLSQTRMDWYNWSEKCINCAR